MQLYLSGLSFRFPNGNQIFDRLDFQFPSGKVGLVGPNGVGKSTFYKLLTGVLQPSDGKIVCPQDLYCLPQSFDPGGQTCLEFIDYARQYAAFQRLMKGEGGTDDLLQLDEDWEIETRLERIFARANLAVKDFERAADTLSGGEMSRLYLSALLERKADLLLMDEPSNHLDAESRRKIYAMIRDRKQAMLVISHDRQLLRYMDHIVELSAGGFRSFGGNYDFYAEQIRLEQEAKKQEVSRAKLALHKANKEKREIHDKQQKRIRQGARSFGKKGLTRSAKKVRANSGEKTAAKLGNIHDASLAKVERRLNAARNAMLHDQQIRIDMDGTQIPAGKRMLVLEDLNLQVGEKWLWDQGLNLALNGAFRLHMAGDNGSGKSCLLHMILGKLQATQGKLEVATEKVMLLDQHLSLLHNEQTVFENIAHYNEQNLAEHELRIRLNRMLFDRQSIEKPVRCLSGGEKVRLALACVLATDNAPDLLLLDEPNNSLDFESLTEMQSALGQFTGAMIVVSHDEDFVRKLGLNQQLLLTKQGGKYRDL